MKFRNLSTTLGVASVLSFSTEHTHAGNIWDGGGDDNIWGTGNNWSPDGSPSPGSGNDLFFAGNTRLTSNNNYGAFDDWRNLIFNPGAGAFTLTGNSIDLFGKIENLSTNTQTVNFTSIALNSASANQFNPGNANLAIGGNVITNGNQLNVFGDNGFNLTFGTSSIISGLGSVAINQNSNVVYQSAHTYTGDTFVNAGSLQFAQGGSANSSTIRIGNNTIDNSPAATVSITDADGGTTVASTINVRASLSGTVGSRTISGTNTSGINTFSGGVFLDQVATITSTNAGGTLAFTGGALELKTFGLLVNGAGNTTILNLITSTGTGNQLTKSGAGTLTLFAANTYTGGTTVSVGTLLASNATGSATGTGTVAVSSGAILGGRGTISGGTTLTAAILAPGSAAATVGTLTFGAGLALNSTSIFEWDMQQVNASDPGAAPAAGGTNAGAYDRVVLNGAANSLTGSGAIFKIVLGSGRSFADAFWDTNKTWNNVFTGNGVATNLATIFSTFNADGLNLSGGLVAGQGTFTLNGPSTLNWTAVPEPSSALAGLLLATGLLRRRRA